MNSNPQQKKVQTKSTSKPTAGPKSQNSGKKKFYEVLIVIPYRPSDKELALKTQFEHERVASVPCTALAVEDTNETGWAKTHNREIAKYDFKYYCFSCADYWPGEQYLKIAIETMELTNKGLCAFNDGKWDGKLCTAGVVTKDYYDKYGLFFDGYRTHGADDELTAKAIKNREYIYESRAFLGEIDSRKRNKTYNKDDQELYYSRLANGSI